MMKMDAVSFKSKSDCGDFRDLSLRSRNLSVLVSI
jgi:hypothetical protein